MKKIIIFISVLFVISCGAKKSKEIRQNVTYDNMKNKYAVTTSYDLPNTYSSCVYCDGIVIDSIRKVEFDKAIHIQQEMFKK